jgi:NAD(P)-dependent dehydrogenase (short-subunit alcohol dehydrogenase family)
MCVDCGKFNWKKRNLEVDLSGKTAIVTGCRIKIGYEITLKLLRCGCRVIGTTRFTHDALKRFSEEPDYEDWKDQLEIFGLDMRFLGDVHAFCGWVLRTKTELHYLINNAAQTISRPQQYYAHLMPGERQPMLHPNIITHENTRFEQVPTPLFLLQDGVEPVKDDFSLSFFEPEFPENQLDEFGQQIDLRKSNSWMQKLEQVPFEDMVEVHAINAFAPFILCNQLQKLMKTTSGMKHVINVSAMEGQFYRHKNDNHPHTNMAKASLNMMTRTCANSMRNDMIFCVAVDTGWVTDERPVQFQTASPMTCPLDCVDGAMRVLDPIFSQSTLFGVFLKDYVPTMW